MTDNMDAFLAANSHITISYKQAQQIIAERPDRLYRWDTVLDWFHSPHQPLPNFYILRAWGTAFRRYVRAGNADEVAALDALVASTPQRLRMHEDTRILERLKRIAQLRNDGQTLKQIAEVEGVTVTRISQLLELARHRNLI